SLSRTSFSRTKGYGRYSNVLHAANRLPGSGGAWRSRRRTMLSDRLNAGRALTADRFHRLCAAIIKSGRFREIGHGALGRHDRRWRDPRDLVRVLAREPLRRPNRRAREGSTGRHAHVAPEHRGGPSPVLPGPGRAALLCEVLP